MAKRRQAQRRPEREEHPELGEVHVMALTWLATAQRRHDEATQARADAVQLCRDFGLSWRVIGERLDISAALASKRFARVAPTVDVELAARVARLGELLADGGDAPTWS